MQKNSTWIVAPLVALLLNLAAVGALADPITIPPEDATPVIVTADATVPSTAITTTTTVPTSTITSTTTTTVTTTAAPSITTTTGTTVPSTTVTAPLPSASPIVTITTTQPITVGSTTMVTPTTSTPLTGAITVGGPGTTGSVPIATSIGPIATLTINPLPDLISTVTLPATPTVTTSGTPAVSTAGSDFDASLSQASAIAAIRTFTIDPNSGQLRYTTIAASVTEPANGISANASATAAVCLLADAVSRTSSDPAAKAYLSTLCSDSPSTASGTAGATAGELASGSVDAAASICLVANALAIPSRTISTAYLASLGLDTRCGTGTAGSDQPLGPSTAGVDLTATALNKATVNGNGAAAVCLIASAIAGAPTTADLATACAAAAAGSPDPTLTPSLLSGGLNATTPIGDLSGDLAAALCVVAHAVADLPTTATLNTACRDAQGDAGPSIVSGSSSVPIPTGGTVGTTPDASTCIRINSIVPGMTSLGETCGTTTPAAPAPVNGGTPVLGVETGPDNSIGSINPILEPSSGVQEAQTTPRDDTALGGLLGQLGITSLPGTATALGGGLLGLALIGLGVAFLRRRQTATT